MAGSAIGAGAQVGRMVLPRTLNEAALRRAPRHERERSVGHTSGFEHPRASGLDEHLDSVLWAAENQRLPSSAETVLLLPNASDALDSDECTEQRTALSAAHRSDRQHVREGFDLSWWIPREVIAASQRIEPYIASTPAASSGRRARSLRLTDSPRMRPKSNVLAAHRQDWPSLSRDRPGLPALIHLYRSLSPTKDQSSPRPAAAQSRSLERTRAVRSGCGWRTARTDRIR